MEGSSEKIPGYETRGTELPGGVKEKNLGLEMVNGGTRSLHKVIEDFFERSSFSSSGDSH
jgi:hypothetical protein